MCGICGFWGRISLEVPLYDIGLRMANAIAPRGPDSVGAVVIGQDGPVLAHRRLSIIDTSEAGFQPMDSASGRFTLVFNGEIYNHLKLRKALADEDAIRDWRGHSDTETILACFEALGIEATLAHLEGMFAFAVWDRETACLSLARDRMGEKPLYFGTIDGVFLFGSELKAFHQHPLFNPTIDRDALTAFVQRGYVPGPYTSYREIRKLQPGQMIRVTWPEKAATRPEIQTNVYWSLREVIATGRSTPFSGTRKDAARDLDKLLSEVIETQLIADVPLGSFLSGGIDSSLVTAIMQKVGDRPVKTFSIGFDDPQFDESQNARAVAQHIGTDHVELIVTPEHLMEVVPQLPEIYCEPFADSSQMPTFLVSKLAKRYATVALTGDGADEIFGGYNRYIVAEKIWRQASQIPRPIRVLLGNTALSVSKSNWDRLLAVLPAHIRPRLLGEKVHKIGRLLKETSKKGYYKSLISMTDNPQELVVNGHLPHTVIDDQAALPHLDEFQQWMMAADTLTYLPDDICVKVDRAAMANSLETRAPFLDRRVVEFAWKLPHDFKVCGSQSKMILRDVLAGYVPRELFERPKMGFSMPLGRWLRGPMRNWAEELLKEDRLVEDGLFDHAELRRVWTAHLEGKGNHEYLLWNVLSFNAWLDHWRK